ncbi:MAG: protein kinase [Thermoanaerobaculia bacterium]|nr:protein kinase [Thermoanaerobaculia bacterium]
MPDAGTTVSHYRILEKLGEGGMGVVYKAEDVRLHRFVALKFLPPGLSDDDRARQRFDAEARAASALDHPNICSLYDVGETADGRLYLALAYCEGQTLSALMARGPMNAAQAVDIGRQIAHGLDEAHAKGIVHRDIKPQNIMVRPDGLVKILDFGVAKLEGSGDITRTSTTVGSPAYMAPEQIRSGAVSPRSDIWALGVVLYELLSGQRPFGSGGVSRVMYAILHDAPTPLRSLRPELSEPVCSAVERALAKAPENRFESATQMIAALSGEGVEVVSQLTPALAYALPDDNPLRDETTRPEVRSPRGTSIAVLPFADLSPEKDQDWFCEGLAEELITALSQVPGLRTASRASTAQFHDHLSDPAVIGRKLRVETLLQGSVRKAGQRLRITTQLVQVEDGSILASDRFDREMEDVFALQEDIAGHVTDTLKLRFAHSLELPVVRAATPSVAAYSLGLKGRHALNLRTAEGVASGIRFFEQALEHDPDYAPAWAGLAAAEIVRGVYAMRPGREAIGDAKSYAREALAREPGHVDARVSLASALCYGDWDWEEAEREFRWAIEQDPDHAVARHTYAICLLAANGRFEEALAQYDTALTTDPVSLAINAGRGAALLFARRYDDCLEQLEATIAIDAGFPLVRQLLAETKLATGDAGAALAELEGDHAPAVEHRAALAGALAAAGREEDARRELAALEAEPGISPDLLATVATALGEEDSALDLLEAAAEARAPHLVWIGHRPIFDPLRGAARFQALVDRMGLS